ncbi:transcriptional regulator TbsP [Natranaeroarchaeum aerophilus]|uniref:DUF5821 family protein n=1 Tax=Natranaeroarchaeum aerophilus TaxID=2917711 RepID=A0AAE3K4E5_9EURY|nr:DUF5821 family protein [Natranaeroarchaeum aerophilus]MCL9813387.1 DUF5821 family protein [Natranaeroarchaeum aerophilus]
MTSNLLDTQLDEILREMIDDADEELLLVNPAEETIETFVDVATHLDGELPSVQLLAEERTLKDVMDDFIIASNTADLVEMGVLTLRTVESPPRNSLVITDESIVALIDTGNEVAGLVSEDDAFVDRTVETYRSRWEAADEFNLRTPPISRVRETLSEEISADAEADFSNILDSLETARGDGDGLDEVTISLLVAAKNEALLYDISKWGEDVGIASKATFSRTKTRLEDMGLIDTEKVPIDVGRPRLRLKFGDDRLRDADNGQLATTAQSILN